MNVGTYSHTLFYTFNCQNKKKKTCLEVDFNKDTDKTSIFRYSIFDNMNRTRFDS